MTHTEHDYEQDDDPSVAVHESQERKPAQPEPSPPEEREAPWPPWGFDAGAFWPWD